MEFLKRQFESGVVAVFNLLPLCISPCCFTVEGKTVFSQGGQATHGVRQPSKWENAHHDASNFVIAELKSTYMAVKKGEPSLTL